MSGLKGFIGLGTCLLLCQFTSNGQGLFESASATDSSTIATAAPSFTMGGYIKAGFYGGKSESNTAETKAEKGLVSLKIDAKKSDIGKAFTDIRLESGLLHGKESLKFNAREAWVQTTIGSLDIKAGQQIIVWGRADGVNPTNNITPSDPLEFSSESDDQRMGNMLLYSAVNWNMLRLEGIWVPVYKPDRLSLESVTLPAGITINPGHYPTTSPENSSYALRLNLEFSQIDGSISYYNGFATQPGFDYALSQTGIALTPTAYRIQAFGGDFSTTRGAYGIRGEVAYKIPYDDYQKSIYVPNPRLEYVFGIDRSIADFNLLLQYAGKYVVDYKEQVAPTLADPSNQVAIGMYQQSLMDYQMRNMNSMFLQQLDQASHSLTMRVGKTFLHETLKPELAGIYNITTQEYVIRPSVSYDIIDAVVVSVGGQYMNGPDSSLFAMTNKSLSYVFAELKYSF